MSPFVLLLFSIVLAVSNNLLLHTLSGKRRLSGGDTLLFNAFVSLIWALCLCPMTGLGGFTPASVLWGLIYGAVFSVFLVSKMQAMSLGSASVSTFISCSATLIHVSFGWFYFHESTSPLQLAGMALLLLAMYLTVSPRGGSSSRKWLLWCAVFFLFSGAGGVTLKLVQASPAKDSVDQVMQIGALFCFAVYSVCAQFVARRGEGRGPAVPRWAILVMVLCGLVSFGYQRLNLTVSGLMPATVMFPVFNGSVILLVALMGALLFRERMEKKQYIGLILGIPALILTAGVFG